METRACDVLGDATRALAADYVWRHPIGVTGNCDSIEAQREMFGMPYLKRPLPLCVRGDSTVFDPYGIPQLGRKIYDDVVSQFSSPMIHGPSVIAVVGPSGSGKTRALHSLTDANLCHPCLVLLIPNRFEKLSDHLPLDSLVRELRRLGPSDASVCACPQFEFRGVCHAIEQLDVAAMNCVRLYVASFVLWALAVDDAYAPTTREEKRRLWLRCFDDSRLEGVASVFRDVMEWARDRTHVQVRAFLASVMGELESNTKTGRDGVVLVFDDIGAMKGIAAGLWYRVKCNKPANGTCEPNGRAPESFVDVRSSPWDMQGECAGASLRKLDLWHVMRLVAIELSANNYWLACGVADEDPAAGDVLKLGVRVRLSLTRSYFGVVDTFPEVRADDMRAFLEETIGFAPDPSDLDLFRGRPSFFATLLSHLFVRGEPSRTAEERFRDARDRAIATNSARVAGFIAKCAADTCNDSLASRMLYEAVFGSNADGSKVKLYVDHLCSTARWLLGSNLVLKTEATTTHHGRRYVFDLRSEPIVFDALRRGAYDDAQHGGDCVLRHIAVLGEHMLCDAFFAQAVAWRVCSRARHIAATSNSPSAPLADVLSPFLPPEFVPHGAFGHVTVAVDHVLNCRESGELVSAALDDPSAVCCGRGPDMLPGVVLAAKHNGRRAVVAIQCHHGGASPRSSTALERFFDRESVSDAEDSGSPDTECTRAPRQVTYDDAVAQYPWIGNNWVRCVAFAQPCDAVTVAAVKRNRRKGEPLCESIVLLRSSDEALGPVHTTLNKRRW